MQEIVFEKPYRFIPPHRGNWWPSFIQRFRFIDRYLRRVEGVASYECRHAERLRQTLAEGHGILLAPNHCRPGDPILMGLLAREAQTHVYAMASWHLYQQSRFNAWAIRKMGGFSVYREGVDRKALNMAIDVLAEAQRPLIIFPEGAVSRTNDRLLALLDGVAFIARSAAKKREKAPSGGKIFVHPVAIKYLFQGNLHRTLDPVLTDIEQRLSWRAHPERSLVDRISQVGLALLALKEVEYFGRPQEGRLHERLHNLIDRLLHPLEQEWLGQPQQGAVISRVKALRMKILPEMVGGKITEQERQRRWHQLADIYLSQQIGSYPPDYLTDKPSVDRLLETVERYEEDLTDKVRTHGGLHAVIEVGERIAVESRRERGVTTDPLMTGIGTSLQRMLNGLAKESRPWTEF
jgi:1-acyl-sn-glycerol-3-phosphate acyltransferase